MEKLYLYKITAILLKSRSNLIVSVLAKNSEDALKLATKYVKEEFDSDIFDDYLESLIQSELVSDKYPGVISAGLTK